MEWSCPTLEHDQNAKSVCIQQSSKNEFLLKSYLLRNMPDLAIADSQNLSTKSAFSQEFWA